ncbi:MAG TPA: alpha/beta hydrolase [Candidatus Binatia bacterium]|jgi:pimeloyl-ACP methyl ester carboxylesterase|nr:alpha/beta hydrolase [Candidatus Binatia bacterium]
MKSAISILLFILSACSVPPAQNQGASPSGSVGGHEAKFIDVNGARTRYYDVGSGEVILLVHGARPSGTSSANTWVPILTGLGKRFRVLAPDRLGHGMTENPKGDYSVTAEMEHLYGFLKVIGVDKFYVIGQSTGAYHAARITLEHPEMVRTLVICDSATLSPPVGNVEERRAAIGLGTGAGGQRGTSSDPKEQFRFAIQQLSKNREHVTEEFVSAAAFMASQPGGQKTDAAMRGEAAKQYEAIIAKGAEEMRGWVKQGRLQTPTLLYWGKNDPSAIPAVGLALFDMISEKNSRARMLIVNNAGHFHYREHPDEFARNVINFITAW